MAGELEPKFTVEVFLDGDDYPPTATENVKAYLDEAVETMKRDGLIREGSVVGEAP